MFVHGGYWKAFDKSNWSHLAEGPLAHGWTVAMPSYDLCPDVHISAITEQMVAALALAAQKTEGPIRLAGHSAGGQLVARLAGLSVDKRVQRVVPISPVADLEPLLQTTMNDDLRLDILEARSESPINYGKPDVPVHVWVGSDERPVFIEQSQQLSNAWGCDLTLAPDQHHFNVVEALAKADSALTQAVAGNG